MTLKGKIQCVKLKAFVEMIECDVNKTRVPNTGWLCLIIGYHKMLLSFIK